MKAEDRLDHQCRLVGLVGRREWVFQGAPPPAGERARRWRIDLAFPDDRVAVEVDGGLMTGGRHGGTPSVVYDLEKLNALAGAGWRVFRVTPAWVREGRALRWVEVALGRRRLDAEIYGRHRLRRRRKGWRNRNAL